MLGTPLDAPAQAWMSEHGPALLGTGEETDGPVETTVRSNKWVCGI
jgi:hypothetical protein